MVSPEMHRLPHPGGVIPRRAGRPWRVNHPSGVTMPECDGGTVRIAYNARKDAMDNGSSYSNSFPLNGTSMVTSACLIGAASIIGITGMMVGSVALCTAARQWFRELEVPPGEVMKHKWGQTKAATMAGASAWQHQNGMQHTHA